MMPKDKHPKDATWVTLYILLAISLHALLCMVARELHLYSFQIQLIWRFLKSQGSLLNLQLQGKNAEGIIFDLLPSFNQQQTLLNIHPPTPLPKKTHIQ